MTIHGRDLDLHGMMDILWLAGAARGNSRTHMEAGGTTSPFPGNSTDDVLNTDVETPAEDAGPPSSARVTTPGAAARELLGGAASAPAQMEARGAGETQLGPSADRLERTTRAVRPLRKWVSRPGGAVLDEEQTVRLSADADHPVVITRRRTERWLELALVLDVSPSMGLWRDTVVETRRALERSGVFRDVRIWRLLPGEDGSLVLHTLSGQRRRPAELLDYSGRRLIAVLTDGIDDRWRQESTMDFLRAWASSNPTAILQTLPPSMWHRTCLPPVPMQARQHPPGIWRHPSPDPRGPANEGWFSVVGVVPESFARWATALADQDRRHTIAAVPLGLLPLPEPPAWEGGAPTAGEQVAAFQSLSSATAFTLAGHLAAAPVTLPVARALQGSVLPESDSSHLAEVLLSGLVERITPSPEPDEDPDTVLYDFASGVRGELLRTRTRTDAFAVLDALADRSDEVAGALGTVDLFEIAEHPRDYLERFPESRATAEAAVAVLGGLGGPYAEAARLVDEVLTPFRLALDAPSVEVEVSPPWPSIEAPPLPMDGPLATLLIDAWLSDERLTCEVAFSGAPLCRQAAVLPQSIARVWNTLSASQETANESLATAGRVLAEAVLDPVALRQLGDLAAGLRPDSEIEVVWRATGAALGLPVELLRLITSDGEDLGPLALINGVSVRRELRGGSPQAVTPGRAGPLRVLAGVAAPDETRTQNPPLDVEAEMQALLDSVGDLAAGAGGQVQILEVASPAQMSAALREGDFHVLHLSAHGTSSHLELEDEDGHPMLVGSHELTTVIDDARAMVPLIVLSSCSSAAGTEGLAVSLVQAGADRVIAMQTQVTDRYATRLFAEFYRELAAGAPEVTVGQALGRARRAVERDRPTDDLNVRPEYAIATLVCAGADAPLADLTLPHVELAPIRPAAGTSLRELGLGQLIGRRPQLREGTAVLRRTRDAVSSHGRISGVQVLGVGGIGKTALAGRLAGRLRGDGMAVAVHEGVWNPTALYAALASVLRPGDPAAAALESARMPDMDKVVIVAQLLASVPVLLVFDSFEQNLSPGGERFLDPAFEEVFGGWCDAAETGAILVTCRYLLPARDRQLVPIPLGPLSRAELHRLLLRLPALRGLTRAELRLLMRAIGGHPRLVEYVHALLGGLPARLRDVPARLRLLAALEGIELRSPRPLEAAVRDALSLGGADIVLNEMLALLSDHGREALLQLSVSRAPMTLGDLAYLLKEEDTGALAAEVERLVDLSLLVPGEAILMHHWIAELLDRRSDPDRSRRHDQALAMRFQRFHQGQGGYDDLIDIARHFAATSQHDEIPRLADQISRVLPGVVSVAAFLAEVGSFIPRTEPAWAAVTIREALAVSTAGDLPSARTLLYDVRSTIQERIAATGSADPLTLAEYATVLMNLGDVTLTVGDLMAARAQVEEAVAVLRRHVDIDPSDSVSQLNLSIGLNKLGEVTSIGGDLTTARLHYETALSIIERLATADSWDPGLRRELAIAWTRLGDVASTAGDLDAAWHHYVDALDVVRRLTGADPTHTDWQRDLVVLLNRLGDLKANAGDLTDAAQRYQEAFDISQRLTAIDPGNTVWLRDLAINGGNLGDVAVAAGDLTGAHLHYQARMDLLQRLAAADQTNADWQRDLSISRNGLGDLALATGDLGAAREQYAGGLDIAQRLAAADPSNALLARNLSIINGRLGDLAATAGDLPEARQRYEARRKILHRLAASDPSNAELQRDLSTVQSRLDIVESTGGDSTVQVRDLVSARELFPAGLAIVQRLVAPDPGNRDWEHMLTDTSARIETVFATETHGGAWTTVIGSDKPPGPASLRLIRSDYLDRTDDCRRAGAAGSSLAH